MSENESEWKSKTNRSYGELYYEVEIYELLKERERQQEKARERERERWSDIGRIGEKCLKECRCILRGRIVYISWGSGNEWARKTNEN